ncbi:MAG: hypothetical protein WED05_02730 [Candidatus Atabeyarchaeum deiterrae]
MTNPHDSILYSELGESVINLAFSVAAIVLFITILLTVNHLRRRFSATTCLLLGIELILFTMAADEQIRLLIFQDLIAPIIDSLLMPLQKLFGLTWRFL